MLTAPVAIARSAPFSFTTMPIISTSRGGASFSSTPSLSAICGTAFGETKLTASMCRKSCRDQRTQILHFALSRNLSRDTLPGIAGAFD